MLNIESSLSGDQVKHLMRKHQVTIEDKTMMTALCLWACLHLDLSIGVHPTTLDDPEITNFDNPIGQADVSYTFTQTSPISIGFQHTSSIPRYEDGYGFNYFYAKWRVK